MNGTTDNKSSSYNYTPNISEKFSWDVVVLGAGPAGCAAAASAAREGARTLLVEATACPGGMGTSGLMPAWAIYGDGKRIVCSGIAERMLNETKACMPHVDKEQIDWVAIDTEVLKRNYDALLEEYGVTIWYLTQFADCIMEGERIRAVVLANKKGLTIHEADVFIDCTGDGDLAVKAGAEFVIGDETGSYQPASLCFAITNVDLDEFKRLEPEKFGGKDDLFGMLAASDKYPEIKSRHACFKEIGPATLGFNAGHMWGVDNTDPEAVASAMSRGRRMAATYHEALKKYFPEAFAQSMLISTASLLGCRESRRIIGEYILEIDDFLQSRTFEDEICRNHNYIDVHPAATDKTSPEEWKEPPRFLPDGKSHGIPYRCLLPKHTKNLLIAGRMISADRPMQGSVRVMPVCLCMGEAAGMAAAMLRSQGGLVRKVNVDSLREKLRLNGAYLP